MSSGELGASAVAAAASATAAEDASAVRTSSAVADPALSSPVAALQRRIAALEVEIVQTKALRDAEGKGSAMWIRFDDELKQLRDELKRKEMQLERLSTGELLATHALPISVCDCMTASSITLLTITRLMLVVLLVTAGAIIFC